MNMNMSLGYRSNRDLYPGGFQRTRCDENLACTTGLGDPGWRVVGLGLVVVAVLV